MGDRKRSEDLRVKLEAEKLSLQRRRDDMAVRMAECESRALAAEETEARMALELRAVSGERDALREALERVSGGMTAQRACNHYKTA